MKKYAWLLMLWALLPVLAGCGGEDAECAHDWEPADCLNPRICSECGETKGKALGHDWAEADCENPKRCVECDETEGEALGHDWAEADCENPETCESCGQTKGETPGHKWQEADCEAPKTCETCGATEGDALEHRWAEADCENPKTCENCGKSKGSALGHTWQEATASAPKTCKTCGKTEGEPLTATVDAFSMTYDTYAAAVSLLVEDDYTLQYQGVSDGYAMYTVLDASTGADLEVGFWVLLNGSNVGGICTYTAQVDSDACFETASMVWAAAVLILDNSFTAECLDALFAATPTVDDDGSLTYNLEYNGLDHYMNVSDEMLMYATFPL